MTISFKDRVAIVTGAGGGLGRAYALELAKRGAKVVVNDLGGDMHGEGGDPSAAMETVAEIKALGGEAVVNGENVADGVGITAKLADRLLGLDRDAEAAEERHDALGLTRAQIQEGFATFKGVKRRMEVIGEPRGITVIDDFAHHPTAVRETVCALGEKYPGRRLVCLFEPRSNTTTRNIFQRELADAFEGAALVFIGPVNRPERYREDEILSTSRLASDLRAHGIEAHAMDDVPAMIAVVADLARAGDVIVLMSNGKFGGAHRMLLDLLSR